MTETASSCRGPYVLPQQSAFRQCADCHYWCDLADIGNVDVGVCSVCDRFAEEREACKILRELAGPHPYADKEARAVYRGLLDDLCYLVRAAREGWV